MDITYLLIIGAAISVLALATLDAIQARRNATTSTPPLASSRRALSK